MNRFSGNKLVSVIIPAYNASSKIESALDCAVSQNYPAYEIIVVNDASTDSTEQTARDFLNRHRCSFRIISHDKNCGVSAARNTGLKAAQGKYIWFIDADDKADGNFMTLLCSKAERENADMVICGYKIYDEEKDSFRCRSIRFSSRLSSARDYFPAWMLRKIPSNIWSCIFRKSFLDDKGLMFHEGCHWGEDEEFFVKALTASRKTCFVNQPLYTYVIHKKTPDTFKPKRRAGEWLKQSINSRWRTVRYILKHSEDRKERKYAVNFYLPQAIIRQFSICARQKDKAGYDKCSKKLKHRKVRELLKSTAKIFFLAPELTFKAYMILFSPKLYYMLKR